MRRIDCNQDLFATAAPPWAPLAGLPQVVPSLWFDADFRGNLYTGSNLTLLQARYGSAPPMTPVSGLAAAPPVAFGTGKAIPGGSAYQTTGSQLPAMGALYVTASSWESTHIIAGTLPPAGATFDASGYMGAGTWYFPEMWPWFLRRQSPTDWRFGWSSVAPVEFAENIFPLAGQPFFFGLRLSTANTLARFECGAVAYEKSVPSYANAPSRTENLTLGAPGAYNGRVWRGNTACYGVMSQAAFTDADVRTLVKQTRGSYGL